MNETTEHTPALKRFRIKTTCYLDGQLRHPGYVTEKPADWVGPHRTVVSQHEIIHVDEDAKRVPLTGRDEPLYEEVDEAAEAAAAAAATPSLDDQIAEVEGVLARLKALKAEQEGPRPT
jgi:hypothetical protein